MLSREVTFKLRPRDKKHIRYMLTLGLSKERMVPCNMQGAQGRGGVGMVNKT